MKRNISISTKNHQYKANGFDIVATDNITNLVDYSVDTILYFCIESIEKNQAKQLLQQLMNKLRPRGSIVIRYTDLKKLSFDFNNSNISTEDFISAIKNITNPLTLDELLTYIDISTFKITNIVREQNYIATTITRTAL